MDMTVSEIVRLIRESAKCGVLELHIGEINVKFREAASPGPDYLPASPGQVPGSSAPNSAVELKLFDEAELLEMEKSQQLVDDPFGFEVDRIRDQIEERRMAWEPDEEA